MSIPITFTISENVTFTFFASKVAGSDLNDKTCLTDLIGKKDCAADVEES